MSVGDSLISSSLIRQNSGDTDHQGIYFLFLQNETLLKVLGDV